MAAAKPESKLQHVAVIMDGNNRWAKKRLLPGVAGHKRGVERVRDTLRACQRHQIPALTVFAFSSENWQRPQAEVDALMDLFSSYLKNEQRKLKEESVELKVIGNRQRFSSTLLDLINEAEAFTAGGRYRLNLAVDYGGRWDIAHAAQTLAQKVQAGELLPEQIDEALMARTISLGDLPPVDLMIRTGGDLRISNFLLWQCAYAEFYFSDVLWPDFTEQSFDQAVAEFHTRQRRFGKTAEQVAGAAHA